MPQNNLQFNEHIAPANSSAAADHRIIVIGASAGGFEAFKTIVKDLPADINASIFIVWHVSPHVPSILPDVLNRLTKVYAAHARDKEEIKPNRIYIAPPDHHLLVEEGIVRVTHGPKENRFRPAIDPLFRSAAYAYTNRVIGVVLSGSLYDGTAGLWTVKRYGGIAVVQDPHEAEVPSMPENALREVEVDYTVPVQDLAALLVKLIKEPLPEKRQDMNDEKTKLEIEVGKENAAAAMDLFNLGELTAYTCPDCHGVLSKLIDGKSAQFRCHTGHAFTADSLMAAITENIENSLYSAIKGMDESVMLLNHLGGHFTGKNNSKLAALYFKKAKETQERAAIVRKAVITHEHLSTDQLAQEAKDE